MNQHVNLTFSLKYLVNFSKSASLSSVVQLMMSNDVPLLVRYSALFPLVSDVFWYRFRMTLDQGSFGITLLPKLETISRHFFVQPPVIYVPTSFLCN